MCLSSKALSSADSTAASIGLLQLLACRCYILKGLCKMSQGQLNCGNHSPMFCNLQCWLSPGTREIHVCCHFAGLLLEKPSRVAVTLSSLSHTLLFLDHTVEETESNTACVHIVVQVLYLSVLCVVGDMQGKPDCMLRTHRTAWEHTHFRCCVVVIKKAEAQL